MNEHRAAVQPVEKCLQRSSVGQHLQPPRAAMPCPMQIGAVLASSTVAGSRWLKALAVSSAVGIWSMSTAHADLVDFHALGEHGTRQEAHLLGEQAPHLGGIGTLAPGRTVLLSSIRRCFAL